MRNVVETRDTGRSSSPLECLILLAPRGTKCESPYVEELTRVKLVLAISKSDADDGGEGQRRRRNKPFEF